MRTCEWGEKPRVSQNNAEAKRAFVSGLCPRPQGDFAACQLRLFFGTANEARGRAPLMGVVRRDEGPLHALEERNAHAGVRAQRAIPVGL